MNLTDVDRIEAEKGDLGEGIKVRDFGDRKGHAGLCQGPPHNLISEPKNRMLLGKSAFCRLDGRSADGTRSYPELRERTCTSGTPRDIEGEKAEVFTNVSVLSGQLSIFIPPLYTLSFRSFVSYH